MAWGWPPMADARKELVEIMAAAMAAKHGIREKGSFGWDLIARDAEAAMAAIEKAGYAVVRVERAGGGDG